MPIYTGVADANGDFIVPFSSNYTGGEKITVSAEKAGAIKTIELYAPSETTGGGSIQFSGNLTNFPNNIGIVSLGVEFTSIGTYSFQAGANMNSMWKKATGLILPDSLLTIGNYAFTGWSASATLTLPATLKLIPLGAFASWSALLKVDIPASVTSIEAYAFQSATSLQEFIVRNITPPSIVLTTFQSANSNFIIKVPATAIEAYQTAPNWSAFASRIQAI